MSNGNAYISHEYIFRITDRVLNSVIYDLGTKYDYICENVSSSSLVSERYAIDDKVIDNAVLFFLLEADFVEEVQKSLTECGKAYFEAMYIYKDVKAAEYLVRHKILCNPIVNLVGQVFFGRGKISIEQLQNLFAYHNVSTQEVEYSEVISFLTLLNKYGIVVYDKKNKSFSVKEPTNTDELITQYYVNPSTPFSNIYNMRRILRASKGKVFWIDKHFRKEGFEIILDGLASDGVDAVTIVSGMDNCTQSAKADYNALKAELNERDIELTWRIINDTTFKWHDRWLVSDTTCYNIPPVLAIIRGQRSDIIQTKVQLDVQPFWDASTSIEVSQGFV